MEVDTWLGYWSGVIDVHHYGVTFDVAIVTLTYKSWLCYNSETLRCGKLIFGGDIGCFDLVGILFDNLVRAISWIP